AARWSCVNLPVPGLQIWSILLLPEVILVGTCPARLFRSTDGGHTWTEPLARIQQGCPRIIHTRVTSLCVHPADSQTMWAGVEIDGVYRSRDAGQTWQAIGKGLSSQDIHALAFVPANDRTGRF